MVRSVFHRRYLVALLAALLLVPFVAAHDARPLERRDLSNIFSFPDNTDTDKSSSATASSKSNTASASATSAASTSQTKSTQASAGSNTSNSQASSTSNSQSQTSGSSSQTTSNSQSTTSAPSSTAPPSTSNVRSTSYSTGADGEVTTEIVTLPASALASGSSSAAGAASTNTDSSSAGLSTGGIVGLSVAGGVALLAVIAFAVFKFSRKRYLDEYDDGEAIKWPELGNHGETSHALPTHRTGGAGFETSSEVNLTRPDSRAGSITPSAAASTVDLYGAQPDPYAVPPLPHLNPSVGGGALQPYRDDPSATYYDPYSGPVPRTLEGEAIPMTQIPGRARSPMPMQGAGMGMGMDGRRSPGPAAALAPPMSVQAGMRSPSPGPGMALRSPSPGPNMAYGANQFA